jgi:hypothetical protein
MTPMRLVRAALTAGLLGGLLVLAPAGCDDARSSRRQNLQRVVLGQSEAVMETTAPMLARIPSAAAFFLLYAPSDDTACDDSIHSLGVVSGNKSELSGITVAGPSGGAFTVSLHAGNQLLPDCTGTIRVTYLDDDGEAVTERPGSCEAAGEIHGLDVDVDLVCDGMTISGEIGVENGGSETAPTDAESALVDALLAIAFDGDAEAHSDEGDGHDHGAGGAGGAGDEHDHEDDHGDEHGHEDEHGHDDGHGGALSLAGAVLVDIEVEVFFTGDGDFVGEFVGTGGTCDMDFSVVTEEGSRAEGGHAHGAGFGDTVIPVEIEMVFGLVDEEREVQDLDAELHGAGMTRAMEHELGPIEPPGGHGHE